MRFRLQTSIFLLFLTVFAIFVTSCGDDSSTNPGKKSFSVSGTIVDLSGNLIPDVLLQLSGENVLKSAVTDSIGEYLITAVQTGSYTITPSKSGYSFIPANKIFSIVDLDRSVNFIAEKVDNVINFKEIPGGAFNMGSDFEDSPDKPEEYIFDYSNEQPVHTVTVNDFEMSITEITEDQYAQFLTKAFAQDLISVTIDTGDAGTGLNIFAQSGKYSGYRLLGHGYIGTVHGYASDSPHNTIQFNEGLFTGPAGIPVKNVTWYGAKMFAEFYGFDLPTEAEWEYACRGGKGYDYGTDDGSIDLTKVNYQPELGPPGTFPVLTVSSYPSNPFGIYDLSGNLSEWCNDFYDEAYYNISPSSNPTGPETGDYKVIRGGSFASWAIDCRASYRTRGYTEGISRFVGFRVVRRPGGSNIELNKHK